MTLLDGRAAMGRCRGGDMSRDRNIAAGGAAGDGDGYMGQKRSLGACICVELEYKRCHC